MGRIARCGLFVALFAVLATGLFTSSSASALGSGGLNPPLCTGFPEFNDWITSHENYNENTAWVAFQRDWTGTPYRGKSAVYVQWNTPATYNENAKLQITGNNVDTFGIGVTNGIGYTIDIPIVGDFTFTQVTSHGQSTGTSYVDIKCLEQFNNIAFHEDYLAAGGSTFDDRNHSAPAGAKSYKPNMTWTVDNYDVTFYSDHSKNTATLPPDYQIYWFFSNTTFDTVQPSEPFAVSGCTAPAFENEHTVPIYFDYGLQAYYADRDCNILSQDLDGNILTEQVEVLPIDGSTFSGSSATDSDYIEESKLVTAIKNISIDQHGLQSLVLAPAQLFTQMATWSGQCNTINLPFIEGKTLSLQCVRSGFSNQYPIIYGTIQAVMSGLIAYFVAIKTFRVIKGANDPEDDKVETYKL